MTYGWFCWFCWCNSCDLFPSPWACTKDHLDSNIHEQWIRRPQHHGVWTWENCWVFFQQRHGGVVVNLLSTFYFPKTRNTLKPQPGGWENWKHNWVSPPGWGFKVCLEFPIQAGISESHWVPSGNQVHSNAAAHPLGSFGSNPTIWSLLWVEDDGLWSRCLSVLCVFFPPRRQQLVTPLIWQRLLHTFLLVGNMEKNNHDFFWVTFDGLKIVLQVYSGMRVLFWAMVLLVATWFHLADPLGLHDRNHSMKLPMETCEFFVWCLSCVLFWDHVIDISLHYGTLQLLVCVGAMLYETDGLPVLGHRNRSGGLCTSKYFFRHEKCFTKNPRLEPSKSKVQLSFARA